MLKPLLAMAEGWRMGSADGCHQRLARRLPIRLGLTAGQAHDGQIANRLLDHLSPRTIVPADKAYDADRIRELIQDQGATPAIPPKSDRKWKPCFSVKMLVWYETHGDIGEAILREKRIKRWRRPWKLALIETINLQWQDLWPGLSEAPAESVVTPLLGPGSTLRFGRDDKEK